MAYTTIDNPEEYFVTTIWTGSGGAKTITGLEFKPDLIWTKTRSVGYNHMLSDSSRGFNANSELGSNSTAAEGGLSAETYGYKSGHTSDGWTMVDGTDTVDGQEDGNTNQPSVTYVGWTWAANGGTTASNSSGTNITSTVQANTTAGFSIVTFTGTGNDGDSYGHGLSSAPELVFPKKRSGTSNWQGYAFDGGNSQYFYLNLTNAFASTSGNSAASSSSVITTDGSGDSNPSGGTVVSYCFHSVKGYSKIGRYTGNGSTDGPFIYTGFKPAWLMIKRSDSTSEWHIWDNKREDYNGNPNNTASRANNNNAESDSTDYSIDFLSNGFKLRNASNLDNASSSTQVYMAFAEHPFVSSEGVPTTAR